MGLLTPEEWSALGLSVRVAVVACLLCLGPGLAIAWVLARRTFRGKALLDTLVHLPLVLPPVAVGYLLLRLLGSSGPIGRLLSTVGVSIVFSWWAAAIASAAM